MSVLVTAASKHGATSEIADAIARSLEQRGLDAEVIYPSDVGDVSRYDAVVLGSAIYMGRWLEPAKRFVDEHADALAARPTWLFSSGPIGDPPKPAAQELADLDEIVTRIGAREHRLFTGRLERSRLSLPERLVVRAVGASDGDGREWDEIAAWAGRIADELQGAAA